jgi:uncharacterized protein YbjT (DUF2867 family)
MHNMLLITGGTGFIGSALLKQLTEVGVRVRLLLRPSGVSPRLPKGIPFDVALSSLLDYRGIRAACNGIDTVIHLASSESRGLRHYNPERELRGTRNLAEAAADAGIDRFIFLSHLGANQTSAYIVSRTKAMEEDAIRKSKVPFTIIRSAIIYGPKDHFTTKLAIQLKLMPFIYLLAGGGEALLQPIWVHDLATAIAWTLDEPATLGQIYEVGGPEFLTYRQVVELVMSKIRVKRILVPFRPPYLRVGAGLLERVFRDPPLTSLWLDYLAINRTTDLGSLPQAFGLQPVRMESNLGYLEKHGWVREFFSKQVKKHT